MHRLRTTRLAADWAGAWWLPVQTHPVVATPISTAMKTEMAILTAFTVTPDGGYFARMRRWFSRMRPWLA